MRSARKASDGPRRRTSISCATTRTWCRQSDSDPSQILCHNKEQCYKATITPQSLHPQHDTSHIVACARAALSPFCCFALFFYPQPNVCSEIMYTHVHSINALSELATEPLRRLALLPACPFAGDSVHGRLCRCLFVDIHLFFNFAGSNQLSITMVLIICLKTEV